MLFKFSRRCGFAVIPSISSIAVVIVAAVVQHRASAARLSDHPVLAMPASIDHTFEAMPMHHRVLWGRVYNPNKHTEWDIRDDCTSSDSENPFFHVVERLRFRPMSARAGMRRSRSEAPAWDRIHHFQDQQARRKICARRASSLPACRRMNYSVGRFQKTR